MGVVGLAMNKKDPSSVRGTKFPEDVQISTGLEMQKKGVKSDKCYCIRTEILRQFPIPEHRDTKCVPESAMWAKLDKYYLTVFVNEPFSVMTEVNENSFSGNLSKKTKSNAMTSYYGAKYSLMYKWKYMSLVDLCKTIVRMFYNRMIAFFR